MMTTVALATPTAALRAAWDTISYSANYYAALTVLADYAKILLLSCMVIESFGYSQA